MTEITIIKQNVKGEETWRYSGRVLQKDSSSILIEANFNRPDTPFHGIVLGEGDRFVEIYYSSRWYNINEIHDRDDDRLKGWYCNVTRPPVIYDDRIEYVDLALDLLVFPDGRQLILDEDEFAELPLDDVTRQKARRALQELRHLVDPSNGFQLSVGADRDPPDDVERPTT
jgi:uncharacterized protein